MVRMVGVMKVEGGMEMLIREMIWSGATGCE